MIDVKQTLNDASERMEMATMYLGDELQRIRAGRANVAILDGVRVDSYGSKVPLNQVASVMVPDARTIAIKPWDKKAIKDIEKAIMDSDVGITPENNGELIRLNLPQPTEERRRDLVKQCNKIGERTKVEIRNVRSDYDRLIKHTTAPPPYPSPKGRGVICTDYHNSIQINGGNYSPPFRGGVRGRGHSFLFLCAA